MTSELGLFEGFGIELEYMIVDRTTLDVRPLSDRVLSSIAGALVSEVEVGELAWSNELVLHVVELKTNGPKPSLRGLADRFHYDVLRINEILEPLSARLMPTGMHPWMDPKSETKLWPHEHNGVYEAFDRIFDCRGHGWSNLQSMHINLPFQGDDEFGRLHAAIRMVLPILPALAASSPFAAASATGFLDTRLDFYRHNCDRVPAVTGHMIPERVFTEDEYQTRLLQPLYGAIRKFDPDGELQYEWLNARGAIARFDRNTIEIRLLDTQECPRADLAIASSVVAVVRALVEERWVSYHDQKRWSAEHLALMLQATIRDGAAARLTDVDYIENLVGDGARVMPVEEIWRKLVVQSMSRSDLSEHSEALDVLVGEGNLASRMLRSWDGTRPSLEGVYRELCGCLETNRMFRVHV